MSSPILQSRRTPFQVCTVNSQSSEFWSVQSITRWPTRNGCQRRKRQWGVDLLLAGALFSRLLGLGQRILLSHRLLEIPDVPFDPRSTECAPESGRRPFFFDGGRCCRCLSAASAVASVGLVLPWSFARLVTFSVDLAVFAVPAALSYLEPELGWARV